MLVMFLIVFNDGVNVVGSDSVVGGGVSCVLVVWLCAIDVGDDVN